MAFYDLAWEVMQRVITKVRVASRGRNKILYEHMVLELLLWPFWKRQPATTHLYLKRRTTSTAIFTTNLYLDEGEPESEMVFGVRKKNVSMSQLSG